MTKRTEKVTEIEMRSVGPSSEHGAKEGIEKERIIDKIRNFFLNLEKQDNRKVRLIKFAIVSTAGLGLNQLMVFLTMLTLNAIFSFDPLYQFTLIGITIKIEKILVAEFVAILFVTVFNYVVNKLWTFRKIEEKAQFNTIVQFIKFAIVGASGTVVNLGLTYLFATVLQWNDYLATAIGFIASVLSNFILNDIWTFNPKFAKRIEAETENREKESR